MEVKGRYPHANPVFGGDRLTRELKYVGDGTFKIRLDDPEQLDMWMEIYLSMAEIFRAYLQYHQESGGTTESSTPINLNIDSNIERYREVRDKRLRDLLQAYLESPEDPIDGTQFDCAVIDAIHDLREKFGLRKAGDPR